MDYAIARHNMVEGQIRPNKVTDQLVIQAMESLPRELFLPKHLRGVAYTDEDISLGNGRSLMEPVVLARLLQAADIESNEIALLIGAGCGYEAAALAKIASTVVAVENDAEVVAEATSVLSSLGIDNAAILDGALTEGYPAQGPYDVIFINGAVEEVPAGLFEQLNDGGRLVTVVRSVSSPIGVATLFTRNGASIGSRPLFDANVPVLSGFTAPPHFTF